MATMATSRVFHILTAGVAFTTLAFQRQSQERITTLESQQLKPAIGKEPVPTPTPTPTHTNEQNDNNSSQLPNTPPITSKARRELYEELQQGRMHMYLHYDHGIRKTCEERCDELEGPCGIYKELEKLHERCKTESKKP